MQALRAQPWRNGAIATDIGFLHNEYGEYDSINNNADLVDLSNARISDFSPDWTANLRVLHTFSLPNGATLPPMVGVYWQSEYEWLGGLDRDSPPSFCFQSDYSKWRTRLTYASPSGRLQLALFGTNVTDELCYERCRDYRGLFL
jgi:hypothetical protein